MGGCWNTWSCHQQGDPLANSRRHVARDGMILSADDPWWDDHYPPDGYGCNCFVQPVSSLTMEDLGKVDEDGNIVPDTPPPDAVKKPKPGEIPAPNPVDATQAPSSITPAEPEAAQIAEPTPSNDIEPNPSPELPAGTDPSSDVTPSADKIEPTLPEISPTDLREVEEAAKAELEEATKSRAEEAAKAEMEAREKDRLERAERIKKLEEEAKKAEKKKKNVEPLEKDASRLEKEESRLTEKADRLIKEANDATKKYREANPSSGFYLPEDVKQKRKDAYEAFADAEDAKKVAKAARKKADDAWEKWGKPAANALGESALQEILDATGIEFTNPLKIDKRQKGALAYYTPGERTLTLDTHSAKQWLDTNPIEYWDGGGFYVDRNTLKKVLIPPKDHLKVILTHELTHDVHYNHKSDFHQTMYNYLSKIFPDHSKYIYVWAPETDRFPYEKWIDRPNMIDKETYEKMVKEKEQK